MESTLKRGDRIYLINSPLKTGTRGTILGRVATMSGFFSVHLDCYDTPKIIEVECLVLLPELEQLAEAASEGPA